MKSNADTIFFLHMITQLKVTFIYSELFYIFISSSIRWNALYTDITDIDIQKERSDPIFRVKEFKEKDQHSFAIYQPIWIKLAEDPNLHGDLITK
jgi:hypothetical protein